MQNYENTIEKYRRELIEFARQNSASHSEPEKKREAVATLADAEENATENNEDDNYSTMSDRGPYKDYDDFKRRNPAEGSLRIQVFAGGRSFPVPDASVRIVVKTQAGETELFTGKADASGIIDNITLPAPDSSRSFDENSVIPPFALYDLRVTSPRFAPSEYRNIPIFDSVKSIQAVDMVPLADGDNKQEALIYDGRPSDLFRGDTNGN